jgi:hypothetical protein
MLLDVRTLWEVRRIEIRGGQGLSGPPVTFVEFI